MARRRIKSPVNPDQLGLNLRGEGFEGPLEACGVFSAAYLARHLRNAPEFAGEGDTGEAFREISEQENARRAARTNGHNSLLQSPIPEKALGLRSSEDDTDPADCPRIATIYNGLSGRGQFIAYRKGDPEGNRWIDNDPLYCEWTTTAVDWLSSSPLARWQGHKFFKMRFVQHTQKWEIGNLRQLPIVMPTRAQHRRIEELADLCSEAKRAEFGDGSPTGYWSRPTRHR
jgi:hypothetical protein